MGRIVTVRGGGNVDSTVLIVAGDVGLMDIRVTIAASRLLATRHGKFNTNLLNRSHTHTAHARTLFFGRLAAHTRSNTLPS